jgi:hypothetical protein
MKILSLPFYLGSNFMGLAYVLKSYAWGIAFFLRVFLKYKNVIVLCLMLLKVILLACQLYPDFDWSAFDQFLESSSLKKEAALLLKVEEVEVKIIAESEENLKEIKLLHAKSGRKMFLFLQLETVILCIACHFLKS